MSKYKKYWIPTEGFKDGYRGVSLIFNDHPTKSYGEDFLENNKHDEYSKVIDIQAYDQERARRIDAEEHLRRVRFALQCMIINKNGAVPTMTDQQVFDEAMKIRDESSEHFAKYEGTKEVEK